MDIVPIYYNDTTNTFDDDGAISVLIPIKKLISHKKTGGIFYYKDPDNYDRTYKVWFPIRELDRTLGYYAKDNTFTNEDDEIMYNLFSLITTNELFMFKKNKKSICILNGLQGGKVSLLYY